jgi:hypothetical protein
VSGTRRYREPRDELDKLYRLLDDKGVATTEEMRKVYDLPVGEQPDMTTLRLTDRAADVLARFTPEVRGSGPYPSRWGDEIGHVLALLETEQPPDLEPGALRDRLRVPQGGRRMVVPRADREALEEHRAGAEAAFARERRGPRAVSPSDIAEYVGERVLAGRLQHEQTVSEQVRKRKGAKRV